MEHYAIYLRKSRANLDVEAHSEGGDPFPAQIRPALACKAVKYNCFGDLSRDRIW